MKQRYSDMINILDINPTFIRKDMVDHVTHLACCLNDNSAFLKQIAVYSTHEFWKFGFVPDLPAGVREVLLKKCEQYGWQVDELVSFTFVYVKPTLQNTLRIRSIVSEVVNPMSIEI